MTRNLAAALVFFLGGFMMQASGGAPSINPAREASIRLGNFSVSLTVKDIAKSREFYERLGFRVWGGDQAKHWLIMQNETATIGLFQGILSRNGLTFNPGWDRSGNPLSDFDDVREIQKLLERSGLELVTKADDSTTGPASLLVMDPDGNPILIDQHVPRARR